MDGRDFENRFTISAEGAFLRGNDLVVPLRPKIRVTYAWPDAHAHHAMIEKANPSDRPGSFGKLAPHTALSLSQ
jgi:hypothetical protein